MMDTACVSTMSKRIGRVVFMLTFAMFVLTSIGPADIGTWCYRDESLTRERWRVCVVGRPVRWDSQTGREVDLHAPAS